MRYYSTNKKVRGVSFKKALFEGLAPDGGLFMPENFPKISILPPKFWKIALKISKKFIKDIPEKKLKNIIKDAFNFEAPLKQLGDNLYVLELFHGPTLAFKDFGARFMSRTMGYYLKQSGRKLKIIVATSGDTGSAVAAGFYNVPNIKVYILYPSGKVSELQEKQLTTFGGNIAAIEVKGTFDDCQKLAKQILGDKELKKKINLSSANSINFGRLLPQCFYYFYGYAQLKKLYPKPYTLNPIFCVPSGNFGNLTAGLMAKKMGLPVYKFIAATNINDVVPEYLKTGKLKPEKSKKTISNAMDVGNPSNFARMLEMYNHNFKLMNRDIEGISIGEKETKMAIRSIYKKYGYIADPHTAVGIAAALKYRGKQPIIVLGTAHPAKFKNIVEPIIGKRIALPPKLKSIVKKKKKLIKIENNLSALKKIILKLNNA